MMPLPAACVVAVFVVILLIGRTVSISSLAAAVLLPVFAAVFHEPLPYILIACLLALVVVWGHRSNLGRLRKHTEPRINLPWSSRSAKNPGEDVSSNSDRETAQ
jgi:glycerol-3-phosphate acyltransferase PlsY